MLYIHSSRSTTGFRLKNYHRPKGCLLDGVPAHSRQGNTPGGWFWYWSQRENGHYRTTCPRHCCWDGLGHTALPTPKPNPHPHPHPHPSLEMPPPPPVHCTQPTPRGGGDATFLFKKKDWSQFLMSVSGMSQIFQQMVQGVTHFYRHSCMA